MQYTIIGLHLLEIIILLVILFEYKDKPKEKIFIPKYKPRDNIKKKKPVVRDDNYSVERENKRL